jgi:hypothetical protein
MMGLDELNSAERRSKFVKSRNLKSVVRCSGSHFVQYLFTQFIRKGFVDIASLPPSLPPSHARMRARAQTLGPNHYTLMPDEQLIICWTFNFLCVFEGKAAVSQKCVLFYGNKKFFEVPPSVGVWDVVWYSTCVCLSMLFLYHFWKCNFAVTISRADSAFRIYRLNASRLN